MKYASALRFGGELIDAQECDHTDFEYLKPLCPECKEPVFLRQGSDRTRNDKTFAVASYWCHFATKDPTLAQRCENRVKRYSIEEIARRQSQARNQRLKLFQRWFWEIVRKLPLSHNEGETLEGIVEPHWQLYDQSPPYRSHSDEVASLVKTALSLRPDRIETVLGQFLDGDFDYFNQKRGEPTPPHLNAYLENFRHSVDLRLQKQITSEAIGFLCSARGLQFLRAFNFNAVIPLFDRGLPAVDPQFILLCVDNAIAIVGLVPWAREFDRVQKVSTPSAQSSGGRA